MVVMSFDTRHTKTVSVIIRLLHQFHNRASLVPNHCHYCHSHPSPPLFSTQRIGGRLGKQARGKSPSQLTTSSVQSSDGSLPRVSQSTREPHDDHNTQWIVIKGLHPAWPPSPALPPNLAEKWEQVDGGDDVAGLGNRVIGYRWW